MDNRPVIFIDSGIGGIPYCMDFIKHNVNEEVYYLADCRNYPYGTRGKEEIISILTALTEQVIKKINPKIIVLACNTASVSALDSLRRAFPQLIFVGTVPAIKPALSASRSGKIGVLGTERTIEDPYILKLANNNCELIPVAAPELIDFIENRFYEADEKEKSQMVKKYIELFREKGADTLVLGCTHFLHLINEFRQEASGFIKIVDSIDGITKRINFLLDENDGSLHAEEGNRKDVRFYLTESQPHDSLWKKRVQNLGFELYMLDEA
jgi:glutamate racemase